MRTEKWIIDEKTEKKIQAEVEYGMRKWHSEVKDEKEQEAI